MRKNTDRIQDHLQSEDLLTSMNSSSDKNRIYAFDFIRVFSTAGIIAYHLMLMFPGDRTASLISSLPYNPGHILVVLFFMLSGAGLYHKNPGMSGPEACSVFYLKRWKRIFPQFYLCYAICFAVTAIESGRFFFHGNPASLLWTLFGLDGYVDYRFNTYYLIGEWFLGALIILYLLYPALSLLIRKADFVPIVAASVFLIVTVRFDVFGMDAFRNPFCCMISFLLGMWIIKHRLPEKKIFFTISVITAVILFMIPLPHLARTATLHLISAAMFFILFRAGDLISEPPKVQHTLSFLSGISYTVFLLHHFVLQQLFLLFS